MLDVLGRKVGRVRERRERRNTTINKLEREREREREKEGGGIESSESDGGLPNHSSFALPDREARTRRCPMVMGGQQSPIVCLTLDRSCFSFPRQPEVACKGERWRSAERVREK